jgi:hypothetical protein
MMSDIRRNPKSCKIFEKCPNTSKRSHAHLQCVHKNWQGLKNVTLKVCEEFITQSRCCLFRTLPKGHMHIFNVSITTVQGLKNVSLKVWEELITQSRHPIKDAHLRTRHSPFYKLEALCATRPNIVLSPKVPGI